MSSINQGDVEREAKHHSELYHVLRNRIGYEDEPEEYEFGNLSLDIVSTEQPTESGFADLVLYDGADPWLVIECKKLAKRGAVEDFEPHSGTVIQQAARYANEVGAPFIATYNGDTLVLLRAHEDHTSLLQRPRITYSESEYEDREDMIFTVLDDMEGLHRGTRDWETDLDTLVDRLRELHQYIYPGLKQSLESKLTSDDDFASNFVAWQEEQGTTYKQKWIDNEKFSKKKVREIHEDFAKQDAYLWINQLLFYKLLEDTDRFQVFTNREFYDASDAEEKILAIEKISVDELEFLQRYLRQRFNRIVEDVDYDAVFSQDEVFGEAPIEGRTADTLNDFIKELDGYDLRGIGRRDFLGDIYEKLIPTNERKALGEFYTPHAIAEFIVDAVVDNSDDIILDPACGTGTFLTAAYKHKKQLDNLEHQEIVDQLVGVDVNRFAAHLAVINLARQNLDEKTERTNILINDFFELEGGEQHPLFSDSAEIDSEDLTDEEARKKVQTVNKRVSNVDGVVANPPYISWTQISPDRRERMRKHLPYKYREGGEKISGKSDIYQYFFTASLEGLDDGDKLGFLTSYKWTTVQGGRNLMTYFLNNSRIKAIIGFNKSLFEDALVNTYITILEKQSEDNDTENIRKDNSVSFIRVENEIEPEKLTTLMNSDTTVEGDGYRVIQQRQGDLYEKEKWSRFIVAPKEYFELTRHPLVTDITEVCEMSAATGTKTQADDFFVIEEDTLERWDLPKEYLTPAIISKRQIDDEQFLFSESDSDKYFLDLHDLTLDIINDVESSAIVGDELQSEVSEDVIEERLKEYLRENGDGVLADYIEHGKSEYINFDDPNDNIHGRGEAWWDLGELAGPRLVMIETRQYRPGVLWNEDQIPVKDTGRPFYAESGTQDDEEVIAGILNSSIGRILIESHGRISGGSAIRMMVYDLKSLPMLDLDQMSADVKNRIRNAFRDWIEADTHSKHDEELDRAVLAAFDEFDGESEDEGNTSDETDWESRWGVFQDKAERMKNIRNESGEVKLLLEDAEDGEELENVVDSGAKVNKTLDDF